jgi:hypothetical protein
MRGIVPLCYDARTTIVKGWIMGFDAQGFLDRYARAYNDRDPEGMRTFFDLSDERFAVSGEGGMGGCGCSGLAGDE